MNERFVAVSTVTCLLF